MGKILCIEDNEDNLFMLHRRLTRAGYDVKITRDGKEGVEWASTMLPDLIVMDLNLPGIDGSEAARRIKARPETRHIPISMLSAQNSVAERDRALAAGCDAYEVKPADFPRLIAKIRSLIGPTAQS
jgi:two-component system, cell cycle response regulator DivK